MTPHAIEEIEAKLTRSLAAIVAALKVAQGVTHATETPPNLSYATMYGAASFTFCIIRELEVEVKNFDEVKKFLNEVAVELGQSPVN